MMKKIISLSLTFIFAIIMSMGAFADNQEMTNTSVSLMTVVIDGENIAVPVVMTNRRGFQRSVGGAQQTEATVYLPISREARTYNNQYVNNLSRRNAATDEFPDPRNYITFTSTINYTNSNGYVLIKSVSLDRNKNADSYLKGIFNPEVTIKCVGVTTDPSWDTMSQIMTKSTFTWNELVYTPATWRPVLTTSDLYHGLATYTVKLLYGENLDTVNCEFTHYLAK